MGDPKFSRRKYYTPSHPWEKTRIEKEKELIKKYGLKNKREVWKAQSILRNYRMQARELMARTRFGDPQAFKEEELLKKKLVRLGLIETDSTLDDILALNIEDILGRRLQTITYLKGLASTPKQARQFVSHGHIRIGDRVVNVPGRLLTKKEEEEVAYSEYSPLANELHPMRPKEEGAPVPPPGETEEEREARKEREKIKLSKKAKKVVEKVVKEENWIA